jgi:hypothetical protein
VRCTITSNNFQRNINTLNFTWFNSSDPQSLSTKLTLPKSHLNADGKIIRKIEIVTLDPFGYSDTDSTMVQKN